MIARRDLLMSLACISAGGAAYQLKPHRRVSLQGKAKLADIVPQQFGAWKSHDVSDLIAPKEENSLASRLYNEMLGRVYTDDRSGANVMMLLAHGDTQSNNLQLHRPEVCYPAFGFAIQKSEVVNLPLGGRVSLPARQLIAHAPERQENILYWARVGEFLPTDGGQQRLNRLQTSMQGVIADGLLARLSLVSNDAGQSFETLGGFVREWLGATQAANRASLIGTERAQELAQVIGA